MKWAMLLVLAAFGTRLAATRMALAADRGHLLPDEARYLDASQDPGVSPLPPGFPAWLGLLQDVSKDVDWLRVAGAALGALSCLALVPLCRAAFPDGSPALLPWAAAWIMALSPLCAASSAWILSESLYVPLLVLAGWGASLGARGRLPGAFAAGAVLVTAQTVRPLALPLLAGTAVWLACAGVRRAAPAFLLGAGLAALGLAAWGGRDLAVRTLWPAARAAGTFKASWKTPTGHLVGGVDRAQEGLSPAGVAGAKLWGLWRPVPRTVQLRTGWTARLSLAAWLLTMPAALGGAAALVRHWRTAGWLLLLPAATTAIHLAFSSSLRYRMPAEPCLAALAAWGYAAAWAAFRSRSAPASAA